MSDSGPTRSEESAPQTLTAPGMKWYVLRVASNKEQQVQAALERKVKIEGLEGRVGRVLVPTVPEKKMKGGVLRVTQRKLYPGYVFVEMACEEDGSLEVDPARSDGAYSSRKAGEEIDELEPRVLVSIAKLPAQEAQELTRTAYLAGHPQERLASRTR